MNSLRVSAIYLAAGLSKRMGENKLALPLGRMTVGSSAFQVALESELDHIFVVSNQDDNLAWLDQSFFLSPFRKRWTHVRCEKSVLGQAYSLKCGIKAARERNPDAIMIILADQPFLLKETIQNIIYAGGKAMLKEEKITYIAAGHQGIPKPPVLFFQAIVPLLLELNGDEGARELLRKSSLKGILFEIGDEETFFDIDTKQDYEKAILKLRK